jgi:hypothetical protein
MNGKTKLILAILAFFIVVGLVLVIIVSSSNEPGETQPTSPNLSHITETSPDYSSGHVEDSSCDDLNICTPSYVAPSGTEETGSPLFPQGEDEEFIYTPEQIKAYYQCYPYNYFEVEKMARNDKIWSVDLEYEGEPFTISVGVKTNFDGAIILNPRCNLAGADAPLKSKRAFGYYFTCSQGTIISDFKNYITHYTARQDGPFNCMVNETYDRSSDAAFRNPEEYGSLWLCELRDAETSTIQMRIIDFRTCRLIGVVGIDIAREGQTYYISDIYDLRVTDEKLNELLIDVAYEGIRSIDRRLTIQPDAYENCEHIIERRTDGPYFSKIVSATEYRMIGSAYVPSDVYAVTINTNSPSFGIITWYIKVYNESSATPTTSIIGYDPITALTQRDRITYGDN